MYRSKQFTIRPLDDVLDDIRQASFRLGARVRKVFVADGDALVMPVEHWVPILRALREAFPRLKQISCYAMASNVNDKTAEQLRTLREAGLGLLYMGPESGDEITMRRLAKQPRPAGAARDENYLFDAHVEAARKAREAGMKLSAIFLLGAGGTERSAEHARASAELATAMDPDYLAALTLTVVEGTPLAATQERMGWKLPEVEGLLEELRTFVTHARPTDAMFRTNHASNYLPLAGRLPADGQKIATVIDMALCGELPLRPEDMRGL